MKRWGELNPVRFDDDELLTYLGEGNFIFVGSSCDMFAKNIPIEWVIKTLQHCVKHNNTYLFQSKNPQYFNLIESVKLDKYILCTTIETNRPYPTIMNNAPDPIDRAIQFERIQKEGKYITVEPVMDFDLRDFVTMLKLCEPKQVNIGADSGGNNLPEPNSQKVRELIEALSEFTVVKQKKNLNRLFGCCK